MTAYRRHHRKLLPCLAACGALTSPLIIAQTEPASGQELDWVDADQLTESQQKQLPAGCCGAFIDPYTAPADALPVEQTPISATAQSIQADGNRAFELHGGVRLEQGPRLLETESATLDQVSGEIVLDGNVTLRETGLLIRADNAQMSTTNEDASVDNARFVLHESRLNGSAGHLQKFGDRLLRMRHGDFTTCEPDNAFWRLKAKELTLYSDKNYGVAKNARLEVADIPVLYIPYLAFPIGDERQSGLLFPSFSQSTNNGVEYAQPFYWNIAPQLDATLTPSYMEKHGTLLDINVRHLSSFFSSELNASYLPDDRGGYDQQSDSAIASGELTEEEAYPHRGEDRWLLQLNQTGGAQSRLKTVIDYTDVSDVDYLRDITSGETDLEYAASIRKFGQVSYTGDHWNLGISANEVRYLNESAQQPYKELPHAFARGQYSLSDLQLSIDSHYSKFDLISYYQRPSHELVVGERLHTAVNLAWPTRWQWGYATPTVGVRDLRYQLEQAPIINTDSTPDPTINNRSPQLNAPQASLDLGMFFERWTQWGDTPLIQTLEPRLFYLYSEYVDHQALYNPLNDSNQALDFDTRLFQMDYNQLFRSTRFNGLDRLDDANQLSVGLTTRFISARTGEEHLALSLGQIYRFETPKVVLDPSAPSEAYSYRQSEYVGRISARASEHFRLSSDVVYDHRNNALTSASASVEYSDDSQRLVNLTYRYQRQTTDLALSADPDTDIVYNQRLNQLDVGAFIPLDGNWSLIGRSHYDFNFDLELDTFAGFEYNDCCYRVRLLWREWLNFDYNSGYDLESANSDDYDRGFFIDLQLKGLASISDRVGNLLRKTIPGYAEREDNLQ
ncbi:LPS-assembly protein LptD [Gilvimarinus agarilyticus]|uniref:LPS-assembly protein LptD n=1 Tax=unclassified Gilvimarinus TaxID=2642066 RepID=UPI001C09AC8E|nr:MULTISPECIES: LPS-assembly protein LptD [unclassified Gilvimarinus]MBU2887592.1 LPS-assembly protein LptD [Gilvimarinus agarilyticus]MDO6572243.1 LPS-assembly protein LptD [Gilvimarinus sp. 2_MG-2023]MDO6746810.1 LPS-assembly protein LptD [Gilvimarinus sp. 1_MG-2023]